MSFGMCLYMLDHGSSEQVDRRGPLNSYTPKDKQSVPKLYSLSSEIPRASQWLHAVKENSSPQSAAR